MSSGDAVARKVIVAVLRAHDVIVQRTADGRWFLGKGEYAEKRHLREYHHRAFLHYLARKFDVQVHLFFNPPPTLSLVDEEPVAN